MSKLDFILKRDVKIHQQRPLKAAEVGGGYHQLSPTIHSPAVMIHHYVYQMSLTSQLPLVTNLSGKLVTAAVEF